MKNHQGSAILSAPLRRLERLELPFVLIVFSLIFISIPLSLGRLGLSWDTVNHHIYLGWVADSPRFDKDYAAASTQAYQFPYLYWPVYKLAIYGFSGQAAGVVLATLHLFTVPPVWMIAKVLIPAQGAYAMSMRFAAVLLAFMSAVPLKMLESTSNDLLAAAPFLWAIALALHGIVQPAPVNDSRITRTALIAGLLAGLAVTFKLSNGPLAVLLPLLFVFCSGRWASRAKWVVLCALAVFVGFIITYGYWGYQLWLQFGNPIYPFYGGYFDLLRNWTGMHQ
jgi:hypothetical protein